MQVPNSCRKTENNKILRAIEPSVPGPNRSTAVPFDPVYRVTRDALAAGGRAVSISVKRSARLFSFEYRVLLLKITGACPSRNAGC